MKKSLQLFFMVTLISSCFSVAEAEMIQNYTTVSRIVTGGGQYTAMPNDGTYNSYAGWVWFPHGFQSNIGQDTELSIIPPVGGEIDLNSRTLTLTGDLYLGSNASIKGGTTSAIDATSGGNTYAIMMSDDMTISTEFTISDDTIIDGGGNRLILASGAKINVAAGATLTLQNMTITGLQGTRINMNATTSKVNFDNCHIWLSGDYTISSGSWDFYNNVIMSGAGNSFIYNSAQTSAITSESKLYIDEGVTFEYTSLATNEISMAANTSYLYLLNGSTLKENGAGTNGLTLATGTVILDGLVTLDVKSGSDGIIFNSAKTVLSAETNAIVKVGKVTVNTVTVGGTNSYFLLDDATASLVLVSNVTTFCDRAFHGKNISNTISSGTYTKATANNILCKRVADIQDYQDSGPGDLDFNTTTTNLLYDLWISKHHLLNIDTGTAGGDITLDGETHFIHTARESKEPAGSDPLIIVTGGNELKLKNVVLKDFSPQYVDLQGGSTILFDDGTTIEMTGNEIIDPSYTMSCNGCVRINCFGSAIDLGTNIQSIDVLASSTLVIENAHITGLSGKNLQLLGDDSTLTLSNCVICMRDDYEFTRGYLNCCLENAIHGGKSFEYKSSQPLTIKGNSELKIDYYTTFTYNSNTKDKIRFEDRTSKLYLNGCNFHVKPVGLQLTKGTLIVDHVVELSGETTGASGAIELGTGTAADDIDVELLPGASLIAPAGYFRHRNIV